jgi:hypothetical protein
MVAAGTGFLVTITGSVLVRFLQGTNSEDIKVVLWEMMNKPGLLADADENIGDRRRDKKRD